MKLFAPPRCRLCGNGVSALGSDLCDSCTDDDFEIERLPLTVAVANQFTWLKTAHDFTEDTGGATYAFSYAAVNPMHWPTGTLLRWTSSASWFLYDPTRGDVVHRFRLEDATARDIAKAVLETLAVGVPHESVHEHDDSELEAALAGAA